MLNMIKVIITVPHGKCPDNFSNSENAKNIERKCDTRAKSAAQIIYQTMIDVDISAELYVSPIFRSEGDMNRTSTRSHDWRQMVQSKIRRYISAGYNVFVLDIHSFPDKSESFGLIRNYIPKIVLLDHVDKPHSELVDDFNLNKHMVGSSLNDIIIQARDAGADSLLLEFNENSRRLSDEEIERFAKKIVSYIKRRGKFNHINFNILIVFIVIGFIILLWILSIIRLIYSPEMSNSIHSPYQI